MLAQLWAEFTFGQFNFGLDLLFAELLVWLLVELALSWVSFGLGWLIFQAGLLLDWLWLGQLLGWVGFCQVGCLSG